MPRDVHRSQTGKKPFRCQICKKRFAYKSGLNLHRNTIHTEKKFKCDICNTFFRRKDHLQEHLYVHSSDRAFGCDQCPATFKRQRYLNSHISKWCPVTRLGANRLLVRNKNPVPVGEVKRSNGRRNSGGANYSLRTRGKRPNYRVDQEEVDEADKSSESGSSANSEIGGDSQENKSNEPKEISSLKNEEPVECEGLVHEEQNGDKNGDQNGVEVVNGSMKRNKGRSPEDSEMIILSSDDDSDQEEEMSVEWSTSTGARLSVVFDVEYVAPE